MFLAYHKVKKLIYQCNHNNIEEFILIKKYNTNLRFPVKKTESESISSRSEIKIENLIQFI